jgi:hypothetical protein
MKIRYTTLNRSLVRFAYFLYTDRNTALDLGGFTEVTTLESLLPQYTHLRMPPPYIK